MMLDYIFMPAILFIGLATSYQDYHSGKIKNKWILWGMYWGVSWYSFLFLWSQLAPHLPLVISPLRFSFLLPTDYLLQIIVNSLISLAVGYLLWHFKLWSAGDAKLFFVFSLLLPLKYYWHSAMPYFPSISLLFNVFTFSLIFLILRNIFILFSDIPSLLFRIKGETKILSKGWQYLKNNYKAFLRAAFLFFTILFIFQIMRYELKLSIGMEASQSNGLYVIFFLLISRFFGYARQILKKMWWIFPLIYAVEIPYLISSEFFKSAEKMSGFSSILKNSLIFAIFIGVVSFLMSYVKKKEKETNMPFALWLFAGVAITIVLKGSIFSLIPKFQSFFATFFGK